MALVFEVIVGDGLALRHYSFMEHWFEVNVSLTAAGDFLEEPHPRLPWTFNCDICTPPRGNERDVYNIDLELDVLVNQDRRCRLIIDEDEFAEAYQQGYFGSKTARWAEAGMTELLALIDDGQFLRFLGTVVPFGTGRPCVLQPPPVKVARRHVPIFQEWNRSGDDERGLSWLGCSGPWRPSR